MADSPELNTPQAPKAKNDELSKQEQEQISGGWGDIQGSSSDDKHKDWSEIPGATTSTGKTAPWAGIEAKSGHDAVREEPQRLFNGNRP